MVSNIRLPFDVPEEQALAEARRLTGLTADEVRAAVYRVSIDARRGRISRVYSVRLDAPMDEQAFAERLQMPFVRYKADAKPDAPRGMRRLAHRPVVDVYKRQPNDHDRRLCRWHDRRHHPGGPAG